MVTNVDSQDSVPIHKQPRFSVIDPPQVAPYLEVLQQRQLLQRLVDLGQQRQIPGSGQALKVPVCLGGDPNRPLVKHQALGISLVLVVSGQQIPPQLELLDRPQARRWVHPFSLQMVRQKLLFNRTLTKKLQPPTTTKT
jgi:hypothetical protein